MVLILQAPLQQADAKRLTGTGPRWAAASNRWLLARVRTN